MGIQKPIIVKRAHHTVSRKDIDPDALSVMRHLNRSGHKAYLVGGGVRDILLGQQPKDFDISTDAEPARIRKLFRNCFLIGRRFRLAHIRFGQNKVIETSTFRRTPVAISAEPDGTADGMVQWDDNEFGTPEEDARRRDFTINALFYDLNDFSIIDHVGGLSDLRKGLIRSIGDPNIRFREDPVRMIRAVRFAARLHFKIESNTRKAMLRHAGDIAHASPARLLDEVYKLFSFRSAEAAFFLLWDLKLMPALFPEVNDYIAATGGHDTPLWRYLAALDSGEHWPGNPSPALMLATLLYEPVRRHMDAAAHRSAHNGDSGTVRIDPFTAPIEQRFKIPRMVRFRILRILEDQIRMDQAAAPPAGEKGRRKIPVHRMVQHESFPESLALLEIRATSGAAEPTTLSFWKDVMASTDQTGDQRQPAHPDADKPPRRRRRRRRKPDHATANP